MRFVRLLREGADAPSVGTGLVVKAIAVEVDWRWHLRQSRRDQNHRLDIPHVDEIAADGSPQHMSYAAAGVHAHDMLVDLPFGLVAVGAARNFPGSRRSPARPPRGADLNARRVAWRSAQRLDAGDPPSPVISSRTSVSSITVTPSASVGRVVEGPSQFGRILQRVQPVDAVLCRLGIEAGELDAQVQELVVGPSAFPGEKQR